MTVSELFDLHAATVAELEAVAPLAGPGDLDARRASREVERIHQKLAKLDAKRRRWPSAKSHDPACWCGACLRFIGQGQAPATRAGDRQQVLSYYTGEEYAALRAEADLRGIKIAALQRALTLEGLPR